MALPTQTAIPDETLHEPNLLRAAAGRRSRQLGDMFEQWILRGCDWYWDKEIAYIEKTPEPMRPLQPYGDRKDPGADEAHRPEERQRAIPRLLHQTGAARF